MSNMEQDYQQGGSSFLKGAFIGALVGAAAALLFAPKPGRELRGDLSDKLTVVSDKTKEVCSSVSSKAAELAKTVSTKASDVMSTVNESRDNIMASVKEAATDVSQEATSASKDVKDQAADATTDVTRELKQTPNH